MPTSRSKRILLSGAAALGIAAGAAGIAGAATGGTGDGGAADTEEHDATYSSSLTVDDSVEATSEADEAAALAEIATVSPEEASAAATAEVPGTAADPELENEDGNVVYGVEVTTPDGTVIEVVVDAGNASILATETEEGDDDADGDHGDGDGEEDDATEAGETDG